MLVHCTRTPRASAVRRPSPRSIRPRTSSGRSRRANINDIGRLLPNPRASAEYAVASDDTQPAAVMAQVSSPGEYNLAMSERPDAERYHRLQLVLGLAGFALGVLYLVAVLLSGAAAALAEALTRLDEAWWAQVALIAAALGVGQALLGFPLRWLRGFWLPRRFGLLYQPFVAWLA